MLIDDFKARFPEFAPARVDAVLPNLILAYPCYYGGAYEDCGKEIILNLLAHLFVESESGTAGTADVTSKTVGNVSVGYADRSKSGGLWSHFSGTKYGRAFDQLTKTGGAARFV
jgi:hypothetical protein